MPVSCAGLDEQVGDRLLEHSGAQALLDVLAAAVLEDDGLDAFALEKLSERETCRPGADDADLRPHQSCGVGWTSSSTRCATANAPFAAGTPQ